MPKNIIMILLGIAVLVLAGVLILPRVGIRDNKKTFDPAAIANEIVLEVGTSSLSNSMLCSAMEGTLGGTSTGTFCRQSRYSPGEARNIIDKIISNYQAQSSGDWNVSEAGYTRIFTNSKRDVVSPYPDDDDVSSYMQGVLVMVTPDIIIVNYGD